MRAMRAEAFSGYEDLKLVEGRPFGRVVLTV
jgi:hypothetical protein